MGYSDQSPRRRRLCAICDDTNETTHLCRDCSADPANAGWSTGLGARRTREIDRYPSSAGRPPDVGPPLRPEPPHVTAVLRLVALHSIRVPVRPSGKARYFPGQPGRHQDHPDTRGPWRHTRRPLHMVEIAYLAGITPRRVARILRRRLGLDRPKR